MEPRLNSHARTPKGAEMSEHNGDRARFQKNRKRKLLYRERVRLLVARLRKKTDEAASADARPRAVPR
jgi:hypothetical protein